MNLTFLLLLLPRVWDDPVQLLAADVGAAAGLVRSIKLIIGLEVVFFDIKSYCVSFSESEKKIGRTYLCHTLVPLPHLLHLAVGEHELYPLLQVVVTKFYKPC